jgi:structural maintenance of chromosome 1
MCVHTTVKEGDELHFMRTIAASGVGSYRINDQEVTWEAYDKRLKDIGVLTKARNFLVFQVLAYEPYA